MERGSNWVPLDEYYYGKKEGDPAYREEKAEFRFKCWFCHKMLYSNLRVMIHMQSHIDSEKQQNLDLSDLTTCKHCYKAFDTPYELQCHIEKVHQNNTNVLVCRICEKDHDTQQALTQHMKCLHNACEMPYICQLCNFRSSFYSDVKDHFKKRHDSSEFVMCLYCLRVFKINFSKANGWGLTQNYYQHLQKHQVKGNVKKCSCCKLAFLNKQDQKTHRQKDHMPNQKGILGNLGGSQVQPLPSKEQVMIKVPDVSGRKGGQYKSLNAPTHIKTKDYRGLRMSITQLMEVSCLECRQPMSVSDHYRKYVECSMCRFATSCSFAYANHMIGFHSGMAQRRQQVIVGNIPAEKKMHRPMFCLCGYTSHYGNSIANHMVFCSKRTCYSSKPELRWIEYDEGDDEDNSFETYAEPIVPDPMSRPGASILDVLGLVKKSSSSRPTVTLEESTTEIVSGIVQDLLDHVFPAESLAQELIGNIIAKLPEDKAKRSFPLHAPSNDDIPPEFTGARKWSTVKIDDIRKPSQASVFLGSGLGPLKDEDTMDSRDSRDDSLGIRDDLDLGSGVDTTDDSTRDGEREEEEEEEEEDDDVVVEDDEKEEEDEMTREEEDALLGPADAEISQEESNLSVLSGKNSLSSAVENDEETPMDVEDSSLVEDVRGEESAEETMETEIKDEVEMEVEEKDHDAVEMGMTETKEESVDGEKEESKEEKNEESMKENDPVDQEAEVTERVAPEKNLELCQKSTKDEADVSVSEKEASGIAAETESTAAEHDAERGEVVDRETVEKPSAQEPEEVHSMEESNDLQATQKKGEDLEDCGKAEEEEEVKETEKVSVAQTEVEDNMDQKMETVADMEKETGAEEELEEEREKDEGGKKPVEEEAEVGEREEEKEEETNEGEKEEAPETVAEKEKVKEEGEKEEKGKTDSVVTTSELYSEPISSPGTPVMDERGPATPLQDEPLAAGYADPKSEKPASTTGAEESEKPVAPEELADPVAPEKSAEPVVPEQATEQKKPEAPSSPEESENPPKGEESAAVVPGPVNLPEEGRSRKSSGSAGDVKKTEDAVVGTQESEKMQQETPSARSVAEAPPGGKTEKVEKTEAPRPQPTTKHGGDGRGDEPRRSSQETSPKVGERRPSYGTPEAKRDDRGKHHERHDNRHHDNRHQNRPYDRDRDYNRDRRDDRGYQSNRGYDNRDRGYGGGSGGYRDNRYGGQGGYGNQGRYGDNRGDRGYQENRGGYGGRGGYNQNQRRGQGYRGGYRGGYY